MTYTHCKVNDSESAPAHCGYRGPYAKSPAGFARHWSEAEQCPTCRRTVRKLEEGERALQARAADAVAAASAHYHIADAEGVMPRAMTLREAAHSQALFSDIARRVTASGNTGLVTWVVTCTERPQRALRNGIEMAVCADR